VTVRGWETHDAARVERILAAVDECESATMSLSDGLLAPKAVDESAEVDLPEGEIATYLLAPVSAEAESAWLTRVSEALRGAE
jgi:hypothetical protein